jgi:hypothetical protein
LPAPLRILAQTPVDDTFHLHRYLVFGLAQRRGLFVQHRRQCRKLGVSQEGAPAGDHFIQQRAKGKNVAPLIYLVPVGLLRRHVGHRSDDRAGFRLEKRIQVDALGDRVRVRFFRLAQLGQAKIQYLHFTLFVDDNVGRFQIAMYNSRAMRRRQPVGDLHRVAKRFGKTQTFAADQFVQRLTCHVLHGDEIHWLSVHLAGVDVVNCNDVTMTQGGCGFRFLREPRPSIRVPQSRCRQNFDSYRTVQVGIQGPINYAHPSRAQLGLDSVMPECLADHRRRNALPRDHLNISNDRTFRLFFV